MFCVNTSRKDDSKSYNFGELGKCMEDGGAAKLQGCLQVGQDTEDLRFKLSNDRFRALMADGHHISLQVFCIIKNLILHLTQIIKKRYSKAETKVLN